MVKEMDLHSYAVKLYKFLEEHNLRNYAIDVRIRARGLSSELLHCFKLLENIVYSEEPHYEMLYTMGEEQPVAIEVLTTKKRNIHPEDLFELAIIKNDKLRGLNLNLYELNSLWIKEVSKGNISTKKQTYKSIW